MKRKAIRLLIWSVGLFVVALTAFIIVLYANKDKVISRVVQESNELLAHPVKVASIDLSIRRFPLASIRLTEVFCQGNTRNSADTLLYAQEAFLEFHLWKLVLGDWGIEQVSLNDGTLNIYIPSVGDPNYQIWKEQTSSGSSVFSITEVSVNDFQFQLNVQQQDFHQKAKIDKASLSGSVYGDQLNLQTEFQFDLIALNLNEQSLLAPSEVYLRLNLIGTADSLHLANGEIALENFPAHFDGMYQPDQFSIEVNGKAWNLTDAYQYYQLQNWSEELTLAQIAGEGDFSFTGVFPLLEGAANYQVDFQCHDASLTKDNVKLRNIDLAGSYQLNQNEARFTLSSFNAKGNSGTIKGSLAVENLEAPRVNLNLISDLELAEWMLLLPLDTIENPMGRMAVNLNLKNSFQSFKAPTAAELKKTKVSGNIELSKVGFDFKNSDKNISSLNASLNFAQDQLEIDNFYFKTGQSDVYLSGHFSNVLGYIFFSSERLKLDAKLQSQELHVEDFLLTGQRSDKEYSLDFARSLDLEVQLAVDQLYFQKFYAEKAHGSIQIKNAYVRAKNVAFDADGGRFEGEFSINMNKGANYALAAQLQGHNVDLHELFISFNNFGQEELVADNIYGEADLSVKLQASLEPNLNLPPESVELLAELRIKDGVLKNYQPMLALSDYAQIDELKEVRFREMSNQISISNSVIYIPEMLVESNVLDMEISGKHSFDHHIDYALKLNLSDVLFKKRQKAKANSEFDEHLTEMERKDDPKIYVRMTGTATNPIIALDKARLNQSIKNDLQNQGEEIKKIFTHKATEKTPKKTPSGIEYSLFEEEDDKDEN